MSQKRSAAELDPDYEDLTEQETKRQRRMEEDGLFLMFLLISFTVFTGVEAPKICISLLIFKRKGHVTLSFLQVDREMVFGRIF